MPTDREGWDDAMQDAPVFAAISVGGGLGALARYEVGLEWPHRAGAIPWSTLGINVFGCFAIGILMVIVTELRQPHRLVRPFLGVGFLGGFTTFSTYTSEVHTLLDDNETTIAFAYLFGTVALAVAAAGAGVVLTRALAGATLWGKP